MSLCHSRQVAVFLKECLLSHWVRGAAKQTRCSRQSRSPTRQARGVGVRGTCLWGPTHTAAPEGPNRIPQGRRTLSAALLGPFGAEIRCSGYRD